MATILHKIARAALDAVNHRPEQSMKEPLQKIGDYMKKTKQSDVTLDPTFEDVIHESQSVGSVDVPPVTYVPICEHNKFTFSMFVLKSGSAIPLHDHPGMHGVVKVLHGKVAIQSYTATLGEQELKELSDDSLIEVRKHDIKVVGEHDDVCYLMPDKKNFHEIRATGGTAAFLDVLFPPYDPDNRACTYYKVEKVSKEDNKVVYLKKIPPPPEFWTHQAAKYVGPAVELQ